MAARLVIIFLLSGSAVVLTLWKTLKPRTQVLPPHLTRVAVLPLVNRSPEPEATDYVLEGIGSSLATHLTKVMGSAVIPWMTSRRYGGQALDSAGTRAVARELQVQALIVGTVHMSEDSVHVSVTLFDAESDERRWTGEFAGPFSSIFDLEASIAVGSASRLKQHLTGEEKEDLQEPRAHDPEAYRAYLEGNDMLKEETQGAYAAAFQRFTRAVELDPNFAEAHLGQGAMLTARYYKNWGGELVDLEKAEASFREALRLDPSLATARRALIHVHFLLGEDEECLKAARSVRPGVVDVENLLARADAYHFAALFDKAIPLYQRVLELDPANANAHAFLAISFSFAGRHEEAIREGEAFLDRFGFDFDVLQFVGRSYSCLGDTAMARTCYARILEVVPQAAGVLLALASVEDRSGHPERREQLLKRAVESLHRQLASNPENPSKQSLLACVYAQLGDVGNVQELETRLLKAYPKNGIVQTHLGLAHAALGQPAQAFVLLRQAVRLGHRYQMSYPCLEYLGVPGLEKTPGYEQFKREYDDFGKRLSATYGDRSAASRSM